MSQKKADKSQPQPRGHNNVPAVPLREFDSYSGHNHFAEHRAQYKRERFRSAYSARGYRMYAPFLTQLSTQYDSVETANVERRERRRMAKNSYEHGSGSRTSSPLLSKRHDLKV